jgi:hypothetical protein
MSQETKNARRAIYDFLESHGVNLLPIRGALRKLLMEYGRQETLTKEGELLVLRDLTRKHRAIIRDLSSRV